MENQKYAFGTVDRIDVNIPEFIEKFDKNWVLFGVDNLYPDFLITLFNKSAMHRTCIMSKLDGVVGQGLSFENEADNYLLKRANPNESWNQVFEKISMDFLLFGGFAINVIFANDGETIAEFYALDFSKVRSGIINPETDQVDTYYYSSNWSNVRKFKPVAYPAYDKMNAKAEPSQIYYYFTYQPGSTYYPLPEYGGSINDIQVDIEVSKFHISNLANGLSPGLVISLNNGVPDTDQARTEIFDEITSAYRGTENAGKMLLMFSIDKEHSPDITPLESANDDYYVTLDKRITSRILSGHRITSPKLIGVYDDSSGFSSNADEIQTAYMHFTATVIKPIQKSMLKVFNQLLYDKGITDKQLQIVPNRIISAPTASDAIA